MKQSQPVVLVVQRIIFESQIVLLFRVILCMVKALVDTVQFHIAMMCLPING